MESIILITCSLIVLLTLALTARCRMAQKKMMWLYPSFSPDKVFPKISVIIPARNEECDIAASLRTVLKQHWVDLEIIVVNDHSTDRTGKIVDKIALADPRVTVIHDPPLKKGWLGKCNAMQHAAAQATSEYLIFADADVLHDPMCFASAFTVMQKQDYDMFSFCPLLVNESIFEHINIPIYFVGFIKLLAMPELADPASSNALASGAFMLLKAHVFHENGGFESVKGEIFDDVGLARVLKAKKFRVSYWFAPECSQVRLFKNAKDAFWGTTKNILGAVEGHAILALPLILVALFQYWTPVFAVIAGSLTASPLLVVVGLGTYAIQYLSFFSVRKFFRFYKVKLLVFPLVVIVSTCCIARALFFKMRGKIYWRGRAIRVK